MKIDESLTIRLPARMRAYLEDVARNQLCTVSVVVRQALLAVMPDEVKAQIWSDDENGN